MRRLRRPTVSIVILMYNSVDWIQRCLDSIAAQTIFDELEVIVADNASSDDSLVKAHRIISNWPNAEVVNLSGNYGYCEGNNRAAEIATGDYLLFLNPDTWLESDCLERLIEEVNRTGAHAASPLVLNYEDDSFQSLGAAGFDCFGFPSARRSHPETREVFMPEGCAYLIKRSVFVELGKFDSFLFMYSDEYDLSFRVWLSEHKAIAVPGARMHHRGAVAVNPEGGGKIQEYRTSDIKRFYANRNGLVVLMKYTTSALFVPLTLQVVYLVFEAVVGGIITRRWSFVKNAYVAAFSSCIRGRREIMANRSAFKQQRRLSDFRLLCFLQLRLNRWDEVKKVVQYGFPSVDRKK
ncbi:MAG: glycosyltransferase family 2 protein [Verrucomicrobia bacterium]|nr:glycosyltransferase family 2 protein [Verrucomicrobiota bacterium]